MRLRILVACLALSGCTGHATVSAASSAPVAGAVYWTTPPTAPTVTQANGVCTVATRNEPLAGDQPVAVGADPTGVTAVWLPTLNAQPCVVRTVTGDARIAALLARDVNAAAVIPANATYHCPVDVGGRVSLYFSFGGEPRVQRVDYAMSGCPWLSAPGSGPRSSSAAFTKDLEQVTPTDLPRDMLPTGLVQ